MAVKTNQYFSDITQDTGRGPSQSIWGQFPTTLFLENAGGGGFGDVGTIIDDDFCPCPTISNTTPAIATFGKWAAWGAAGTTLTDGAQEGGVLKINGGTANKSFIITSNAGWFRLVGASTAFTLYSRFACEMRIALGSVSASQQGVFFGLADNTSSQINSSDTTIIASGGDTLTTTKNLIGVFNRTTTGPADFSAVFQPAAGTAVYPTNLTTLVNTVTGSNMAAFAAGTDGKGTGFVKIGFVFDPTPQNEPLLISSASSGQTAGNIAKPLIKFYVNGQRLPAFLTSTNLQAATFPAGAIFSPVFNYMNIAGGSAPVYLDWVRFGAFGTF